MTKFIDSNDLFKKLWQFSADLVQKGFKIIEVGKTDKFLEGEIPLVDTETDKYILRAYAKGKPIYSTLTLDGITYKAISVESKTYIPDKNLISN